MQVALEGKLKYLVILTDRSRGSRCASSEFTEAASDKAIVIKTLEPHTRQDVRTWLFDGSVGELRDHISQERGLEIAIVNYETLERVL